MRSIMDYGMGLLWLGMGIFLIFMINLIPGWKQGMMILP